MAIKVHGVLMSTCTARVLLCLYEKGIDFEFVPIDLAAGTHREQPYLLKNPFGQAPTLEDGDLSLFESRAINRYLARKHKETGSDLLLCDDEEKCAIVDAWQEVEAQQFNRPLTAIFSQIFVHPMFEIPPDEQIMETETERLAKVLNVYEERLSKSKYLAGEEYTLADLHHIPGLVYFMRTSMAFLITSRPNVNAWWKDISSRPASIKVAEGLKMEWIRY